MTAFRPSRRSMLASLLGAAPFASGTEILPPVRAITRGPRHHWFGYYDKLEFDPGNRYVLGMQVDFEHRSPRPDDIIGIGMVDIQSGDRWIELGKSRAWGWQQGCMLQWIPGSDSEIIWNDRQGDRFVAYILNVRTRKRRTLPAPVYALSPDGKWAISTDFSRLNDCRPGYGYAGIADPGKDTAAPDDNGIWRIDLASGRRDLLISYAAAARIPYEKGGLERAKHWFNHLLVSPDGSRFIFLHRWRGAEHGQSWETRMFTANADGTGLYILDPYGKTSHFIWRDPRHVLAWAWHPSRGDKFYLYRDRSRQVEAVAPDVMTTNGHCTYLPGNQWILNDTYPDRDRNQNPYLYSVSSGRRYPLGHFHSPPAYRGEWRCDTHPRFSPDGKQVVIDSPHGGNGRQLYLIDISGITG
ncbi:MAG: hypothetical protein LC130_05920 [Bryobacterales bacterium]|nr:hypothetical protein [Bryobacterales bacterium]MEB2362044.1 hypothetical protein [Bryobacterales bacterium]